MADVSRKDFLGLSTAAAAGLASGCVPIADAGNVTADLVVVGAEYVRRRVIRQSQKLLP